MFLSALLNVHNAHIYFFMVVINRSGATKCPHPLMTHGETPPAWFVLEAIERDLWFGERTRR